MKRWLITAIVDCEEPPGLADFVNDSGDGATPPFLVACWNEEEITNIMSIEESAKYLGDELP